MDREHPDRYSKGCRCWTCTTANRLRVAEWRARQRAKVCDPECRDPQAVCSCGPAQSDGTDRG